MRSILGIAFLFAAFLNLAAGRVQEPEPVPKLTKTSDDSTPKLHRWKFEQTTNAKLVAVVRVEHLVVGTIVESFDEATFCPENAEIGSLTVELDGEQPHLPKVTLPAMNNYLRFRIDPAWQAVKENRREVECADGKRRQAREVEITGAHETIRISFYAAPPEIFNAKELKMPDLKEKGMARIVQRFTTLKADAFVISGPNQEEKAEQIGVRPRQKKL